jgi:hypothetical protein
VQCAFAGEPDVLAAAALRARHAALADTLESSPIQRGLHVESVDSSTAPRGDAYAVVDYPFALMATAFATPAALCESLILHINVQYCREAGDEQSRALSLGLGKKTLQDLDDVHRIEFRFGVRAGTQFLRVELTAAQGPLRTRDYLIAVELVALDERRTFMHIRYQYEQGLLARAATSAYFATNGRDKIGFTRIRDERGGTPEPVRGIRGVLERNTMRYYLAFEAYLHTRDLPAAQRFEARLERWFSQTERFARQLRELGYDEYLALKRQQYRRQQESF